MISKTSTAINFLGIPLVAAYMEQILKNFPKHKNKIISIGSGGGYIEKVLDKLLNVDIICVDPEPLSYITEKVIYKYPKYKTIDSDEFPLDEYKNDCILFVNWSTPDKTNGYDVDAILKLNPICILTTVETGFYRGSGSIGFHHFLSTNGIITKGVYTKGMDKCEEPEKINFENNKYSYNIYTTCNYKKNGYDESLKFQIILFAKKQLSICLIPGVVEPYDSAENMNENNSLNKNWIPIRKRIEPLVKNLKILPANEDDNINEDNNVAKKSEKKIKLKKVDDSWNEYIESLIIKKDNKKITKQLNNQNN